MHAANAVVRDRACGGEAFIGVGVGCLVAEVARDFQLPSLAVALGASMFQRAVTSDVKCDPDLEGALCPLGAIRFCKPEGGFEAAWRDTGDTWSLLVYLVCVNLALKSLHYPRTAPRKLGGFCSIHGLVRQVCTRRPLADVWATWKVIRPKGDRKPSVFEGVEVWVMRRLRWNLGLRPMPSPPAPAGSTGSAGSSSSTSPTTVLVDSRRAPEKSVKSV